MKRDQFLYEQHGLPQLFRQFAGRVHHMLFHFSGDYIYIYILYMHEPLIQRCQLEYINC